MLYRGDCALGGIVSVNCPAIVEVMALGGLDFVLLDTEHGDMNFESVTNMVRAAEAHGISAIVRVTDSNVKTIGRYLDNGAHGIQAPMIETADMAEQVARACRFPPQGARGLSGGRAARWGHVPNFTQAANREVLSVCMCETEQAVHNINQIAQAPELDVVFVGVGDLSQSLGHTGEFDHPVVKEAVEHVLQACKRAGMIPGIVTTHLEDAVRRLEQGFLYVTVMNDMRFLCSSVGSLSREVRAAVGR